MGLCRVVVDKTKLLAAAPAELCQEKIFHLAARLLTALAADRVAGKKKDSSSRCAIAIQRAAGIQSTHQTAGSQETSEQKKH